jgi:hypothetical protein
VCSAVAGEPVPRDAQRRGGAVAQADGREIAGVDLPIEALSQLAESRADLFGREKGRPGCGLDHALLLSDESPLGGLRAYGWYCWTAG